VENEADTEKAGQGSPEKIKAGKTGLESSHISRC
jgi:hypothetical protein